MGDIGGSVVNQVHEKLMEESMMLACGLDTDGVPVDSVIAHAATLLV